MSKKRCLLGRHEEGSQESGGQGFHDQAGKHGELDTRSCDKYFISTLKSLETTPEG